MITWPLILVGAGAIIAAIYAVVFFVLDSRKTHTVYVDRDRCIHEYACGPLDPDVLYTVTALRESGDIRDDDLMGWESVEAGIRRNERGHILDNIEAAHSRHADDDNYCDEADIAWSRALDVVKRGQ